MLAISYNIHLSEKDLLNEIVNPFSGERYPNFPKTLYEVRDWNGEHLNVCEIEQGPISHVVLEISSLMNFLECAPSIPRPETDQEEEAKEQAIQEIKRMVGLPLGDPKPAARTDRSLKLSANKIKSGRITKPPASKKATAKTSSMKTAMRMEKDT